MAVRGHRDQVDPLFGGHLDQLGCGSPIASRARETKPAPHSPSHKRSRYARSSRISSDSRSSRSSKWRAAQPSATCTSSSRGAGQPRQLFDVLQHRAVGAGVLNRDENVAVHGFSFPACRHCRLPNPESVPACAPAPLMMRELKSDDLLRFSGPTSWQAGSANVGNAASGHERLPQQPHVERGDQRRRPATRAPASSAARPARPSCACPR